MALASNLLTLQFYKANDYTDEMLEVLSYNKDRNAFQIRYRAVNTYGRQTWWCPHNMLESYIFDFFNMYYTDVKLEADGFQMDCQMMPVINVRMPKNDTVVLETLKSALRMLFAFAEHGAPV